MQDQSVERFAEVRKVKFHLVMPRSLTNTVHVADALCRNQGTNSSTSHAQSAAARAGPIGLEFADADNIRVHLAMECRSRGISERRQNTRWVQKDLGNDTPKYGVEPRV